MTGRLNVENPLHLGILHAIFPVIPLRRHAVVPVQNTLPSPFIKDYCVPGTVVGALQVIFISQSNLAKELLRYYFIDKDEEIEPQEG